VELPKQLSFVDIVVEFALWMSVCILMLTYPTQQRYRFSIAK